jgi:hypothetical protein
VRAVYLLVFASTLLADIAWTRYTLAVGARAAVTAGIWSTLIVLFGAFNITAYVTDSRAIIPAALGAFVGTWWAVWNDKK